MVMSLFLKLGRYLALNFRFVKNTKSLFRNKDVNDQSRSGLSDG